MILYNVTVNVNEEIADEWLDWMKSKHIPDVMSTRLFTDYKIYKIITDDEGSTFSVQYFLKSMDDYENYLKNFATALQSEHTERFRDKFAAFRTIMESA
ncbi:MAG: hypothetical protein HGGPFJEG_01541 [Ignavibacteria bacterium]|nr:hypothetical protein [Ignavibacteria bacterium]